MCFSCPFLDELVWDSVCWPRCVSLLPVTQIQGMRRVFQILLESILLPPGKTSCAQSCSFPCKQNSLQENLCFFAGKCPPLPSRAMLSSEAISIIPCLGALFNSGNLKSLGPKHCPLREARYRVVKEADSYGPTATPKASFCYSQLGCLLPEASCVPHFPQRRG